MTTTFELSITMGNAAMLTGADVAQALADLATNRDGSLADFRPGTFGIYDLNGNRVGEWRFDTND